MFVCTLRVVQNGFTETKAKLTLPKRGGADCSIKAIRYTKTDWD